MFDGHLVGRLFVVAGVILMVVGLLIMFGCRLSWLGKLPGDIYIHKKNFVFIFPLATSILVSIILSILLFLLRRK